MAAVNFNEIGNACDPGLVHGDGAIVSPRKPPQQTPDAERHIASNHAEIAAALPLGNAAEHTFLRALPKQPPQGPRPLHTLRHDAASG